MINLNLPEPEEKHCVTCFRKYGKMKGSLIHWPDADCKKKEVKIITGAMIPTFSVWLYECQWCRGIETKRKKRIKKSWKN